MAVETTSFPSIWTKDPLVPRTIADIFQTEMALVKSRLISTGAILFKGFGIDTTAKLEACTRAFPESPLDYVDGNSPRTKLNDKIYTSTEYPPEYLIPLHNELSYAHRWPKHLFFCCEVAPLKGGHTLIANGREMLSEMAQEVLEAFRQKGVCYIRNLHAGFGLGPSWMDTFETNSRMEVEAHCQANKVEFEWIGDNLRLRQFREATLIHPISQEEVWFAQVDQFHPSGLEEDVADSLMEIYSDDLQAMPQYVTFGDASEIPVEIVHEIRRVKNRKTVFFNWEKGDLLLLDNVLTAHGRSSFEGDRRILVSMVG